MLNDFRSLRVAVLCSRRAPGLSDLLHHPIRRKVFDIACVLTTEAEMAGQEEIEEAGIPVMPHPIRRFFDERDATLSDVETRRQYDGVTADVLRHLNVDTVILLGYLYVLTDVMLRAFPGRIVNIHDSDLTLSSPSGERRYTGLHSTRDAIVAGEPETRSSVHFVTAKLDGGPVLLLSDRYPVAPFAREAASAGATDIVKSYSYAHREWMIRDSWGPLLVRSIEYLAAGVDDGDLTIMTYRPAELTAVPS